MARVRGQVGSSTRYLTWKEIGPKVSDGKKPGWQNNQGRDNRVSLYYYYYYCYYNNNIIIIINVIINIIIFINNMIFSSTIRWKIYKYTYLFTCHLWPYIIIRRRSCLLLLIENQCFCLCSIFFATISLILPKFCIIVVS